MSKLCTEAGNDAALFAQHLGPFPPGTLVRLANRAIGVVARRAGDGVVLVHALRGADGQPLSAPRRPA